LCADRQKAKAPAALEKAISLNSSLKVRAKMDKNLYTTLNFVSLAHQYCLIETVMNHLLMQKSVML